jgi:sugar phosphate permease
LIKQKQPIHFMLLLILAGEAIFILPFVLARVFRPTFLDVFNLTNLELGTLFSIYGVVAMISYLLGGWLADRFQPRLLISFALFLTAIGGIFMSAYPSYNIMKLIFGYWGFTTIFLFWGAMIKATRIWGGANMQGRAFGILDGGRGLVAAGIGSLAVLIFSIFTNVDIEAASLVERKEAFRYVILFSSSFVGIIGLLVLLFMNLKNDDNSLGENSQMKISISNFREVAKIPSVWWLMLIILCAYVAYKITDVFSLYAKEVMFYNEIEAAQVGTFLLYIRPVVGISIGILADQSRKSLWMILGFIVMLLGSLIFASGIIDANMHIPFFLSLIGTAIGTYAIRALYFAALKEGNIPLSITGTAVGIISFVGFTPDIFVGPIMGYLLDNSPGETGHQHVFIMLAIFASIGLLASWVFYRKTTRELRT